MHVHVSGIYMAGAGLTSVLMRLAAHMAREVRVSLLGFAPGATIAADVEAAGMPLRIQPAAVRMLADQRWLEGLMRDDPPDVFVVMGPAFLARSWLQQLQPYRGAARILLYLPTEGRVKNDTLADVLAMVDDCILYTQSAALDVGRLVEARSATDRTFQVPRLGHVGHGVDRMTFHPTGLREDVRARHAVRQGWWETSDPGEFVVLNVNRPYYRKRLDLAIAGFGEFARGRSGVRLVLHPGATSREQRADLERWRAESGAADRITILPPDLQFDEAGLNDLYNACDVGLTTAMGEGWGLTVFEHAATGAAQIVPAHTSFRENWEGAAIMVPTTSIHPIFYEYGDMFAPSAHHVAEALASCHSDPAERATLGAAALARASEPRFAWEQVCSRFHCHVMKRNSSMRSQQLVDAFKAVVRRDTSSNPSIINYFLTNNIKGGWEGWLQTVYAQAVFTSVGADVTDFNREVYYPGTALKCDLYFSGRGVPIFVELKTQRYQTYVNAVTDFQSDVTKIRSLGSAFLGANVCVALAILAVSDADKKTLDAYRNNRPSGALAYYVYAGGQWTDITENISTVPTSTVVLLAWRAN